MRKFWTTKSVLTEENTELVEEMILIQELILHQQKFHVNLILTADNWSRPSSSASEEMQGANTYWFEHYKAHDPFKKDNVKVYSENITTAFFSDEKIFKVKQLYNSHNDMVRVSKKLRKVEEPEVRLFCEIEAFPK